MSHLCQGVSCVSDESLIVCVNVNTLDSKCSHTVSIGCVNTLDIECPHTVSIGCSLNITSSWVVLCFRGSGDCGASSCWGCGITGYS